jgi:ribonuclease HI
MVPGWEDDQSPYRSKLTGIVGNLTLLLAVCYSFDVQSGSVTEALDGDSAMKQAMRQVDTTIPLKADQSHFDLLQVCRSILKRLPIEIKWRWVESHQREKGLTTLDWWARKNDWCDNKAKAFGHRCCT